MDEQAKLQYRIAQLEAQVDRAKRAKALQHSPQRESLARPRPGRWAPYGQPHRNLSLVLTNAAPSLQSHDQSQIPSTTSSSDLNLVKPVGRSHQLVNENVLKREQKQQEELRKKMHASRDHRTRSEAVVVTSHATPTPTARLMELDGIHYRVSDDGSKLTRAREGVNDNPTKETPKKATIAGVTFLRTKHGNLLRAASTIKAESLTKSKPQCEHFTKDGTTLILTSSPASRLRRDFCHRHWLAGKCPWGHNCKFAHDPEKVAVCKEFLRSGHCAQSSSCDLSHKLSYHRVSACTHFLRGNCTNDACRYPHVSVSPTAPVCRAFATLGYCNNGSKCGKRHVVECPDYANTGHCANHDRGKCKLPHVERANTLRKAAKRQAKMGSENESDLSSDEEHDEPSDVEEDSNRIESDIEEMFDDLLMSGVGNAGASQPNHAFTTQQDFVRIS